MSEDLYRLLVVTCLVVIAGSLLGGMIGIGVNSNDIADAIKDARP